MGCLEKRPADGVQARDGLSPPGLSLSPRCVCECVCWKRCLDGVAPLTSRRANPHRAAAGSVLPRPAALRGDGGNRVLVMLAALTRCPTHSPLAHPSLTSIHPTCLSDLAHPSFTPRLPFVCLSFTPHQLFILVMLAICCYVLLSDTFVVKNAMYRCARQASRLFFFLSPSLYLWLGPHRSWFRQTLRFCECVRPPPAPFSFASALWRTFPVLCVAIPGYAVLFLVSRLYKCALVSSRRTLGGGDSYLPTPYAFAFERSPLFLPAFTGSRSFTPATPLPPCGFTGVTIPSGSFRCLQRPSSPVVEHWQWSSFLLSASPDWFVFPHPTPRNFQAYWGGGVLWDAHTCCAPAPRYPTALHAGGSFSLTFRLAWPRSACSQLAKCTSVR